MRQQFYFEFGAIQELERILFELEATRILLVTSKEAFALSGAEVALRSILQPYQITCFKEFEPNPKLTDVERGLDLYRSAEFDAVVAVGGGSVIDMAKLINILSAQESAPLKTIQCRENIRRKGSPLIAIPTTSGTGSEATHFAVVYVDHTKYSVAHDYILPDVALVDPCLTLSMPGELTAITGMDAFSQAVESYWSVNSSQRSKQYATEAIHLVMTNLEAAVHEPANPAARKAMARAAHLAGRAIDISKTTASHAISYTITSFFGVPHGHAVCLTLGELLVFNSQVSEADVTDPRGVDYVRQTIDEVGQLLGASNAAAARDKISDLMASVGLESRLGALGVTTESDRNLIVEGVNPERLVNNPRSVTRASVAEILWRLT